MGDRSSQDSSAQAEPKTPLPRLTGRVFTDLAIWMTGLGILMGLAFPFFAVLMGVPSEFVLTPGFIAATVAAGVVVGASNQLLSRAVVGSKLRGMQARMESVEGTLRENMYSENPQECDPESCSLKVDSDDAIGHAAAAFNRLVEALAVSHEASRTSGDFSKMLASHIELGSLTDDALREIRSVGSFEASALCIARDGRMVTVSSQGISDPEGLADTEPMTEAFRTLEAVHMSLPADIQVDAAMYSSKVAGRNRLTLTGV